MTQPVSVETSTTSGTKHQDFLLVSRFMDFLLLGGLSILIWIPVYFLQDTINQANLLATGLAAMALSLAYWVNFPHFMASYKLAYTQGNEFITRTWFQLIFVPIALVIALSISFNFWSASITNSGFVLFINGTFEFLGLNTRIGQHPSFGPEILGLLVMLMFFTVGWHYSKQAFGCMMVYAKIDNYRMSIIERNIIRYALLSTWWVTWLYSNCSEGTYPFYGLEIYRFNLPYVWFQASYVIVSLMFLAVIAIFVRIYLREKKLPSVNFLVPMAALLIWHIPLFGNPQFFYVLAFFHSLQYFPFVAKVEQTRYERDNRPKANTRLLVFFGIMMLLGFLSFDYIPNSLDQMRTSFSVYHASFFMISFLIFINIHHYFIDNVLWRFKNKEVRNLLFD
jgi:uncharacterized membrane protein YhdT